MVNFRGAHSEKLAYYVAKEKALDDALEAIKKCFDKEQISHQDYLRAIRKLSERQFKAMYRQRKLVQNMQQNNVQQF